MAKKIEPKKTEAKTAKTEKNMYQLADDLRQDIKRLLVEKAGRRLQNTMLPGQKRKELAILLTKIHMEEMKNK